MRPRIVKIATCNLNQWALDFEGNLERTKESLRVAHEAGATYRLGPELELCGYGCEDHFSETDTTEHSWECLISIIQSGLTENMVVDVGMPVVHLGVRYNCRVILLNGSILLIRPKQELANDGNYREPRYFAAWKKGTSLETFHLPPDVAAATGQDSVPIGNAVLQFNDALVASETCEELFTPDSPHIQLALNGVEIIMNGSGSHHQLRKLNQRLDLIRSASAKCGGLYVYANQQGCDGSRLYYDGCASIALNGSLLAQGSQFSLRDVEVVTATVNLDDVVSYRGVISSLREQASSSARLPVVRVPFDLCCTSSGALLDLTQTIPARIHDPEEEIALGPAAWLWDYLRRSGASGFLLPLSGGADSSATAAIVGSMCKMVMSEIAKGNKTVEDDCRRIGGYGADERISDPAEFASRIFVTIYLGSENSSSETQGRAAALAAEIGSYHLRAPIQSVVVSMLGVFSSVTGRSPKFSVHGGSHAENLAMQNVQARTRMALSFLFASLVPWVRGQKGFLLVLGSANVDEGLRGYLTKYDCSSADINPIGGISKDDIRRFLLWGSKNLGFETLAQVESAAPTAELEPLKDGSIAQLDEVDMGMTYDELSMYGKLRKASLDGGRELYEVFFYLQRTPNVKVSFCPVSRDTGVPMWSRVNVPQAAFHVARDAGQGSG